MNVIEISGKLYVEGNHSHQEILNILYKLKDYGLHFAGTSKDITAEYIVNERYIKER